MKIKKNSMNKKLIMISLSISFTTIIFLVICLWAIGIIDIISLKSYKDFNNKTAITKSNIKRNLISDAKNINTYASQITNIYNNIENNNNYNTKHNEFINNTIPVITKILNSSNSRTVFIIFNNYQHNNKHKLTSVDNELVIYHKYNNDISIFTPYSYIINPFNDNTYLNKQNINNIKLTKENLDILTEPTRLAIEHPNSKDISKMGYWKISNQITNNKKKMLTYSIPLIDNSGIIFAVIGIEFPEKYFYKLFVQTTNKEDSYVHILAYVNNKTTTFIPVLTNDFQNKIITLNKPLKLEPLHQNLNQYILKNSKCKQKIIANIAPLNLYTNKYYNNKDLVLINLCDKRTLNNTLDNFIFTIVITIICIIILVTVLLIYISKNMITPITKLSSKIKSNSIENILKLNQLKTGFKETDDLITKIKYLSKKEYEANLRTDKFIEMANLSFGTFEYNKSDNIVKCSKSLLPLIKISNTKSNQQYISMKSFKDKYNEIIKKPENEFKDVYLIEEHPNKWVKIIQSENEETVWGICMDVTKDVIEKHHIMFERDYDKMTGLLNRSAFKRNINNIFNGKINNISAFIMFNIDDLKFINNTYGHDIGDMYITCVANVLKEVFNKDCIVSRISGDEFSIFLQNYESKYEVWQLINEMYEQFDKNYLTSPDGNTFKMRISGGIAWYEDEKISSKELMRYADFAMYQSKHTIKGCVREFDKQIYLNESYMVSGREELNKILDNSLIEYVYQPIVLANTGEIYGYEALLRPQSNVLNTPVKLLKLAAIQSKLWKIEKITFTKVLKYYYENQDKFNNCKLFINSIPNEFLNYKHIEYINTKYKNILYNLVVEITEEEHIKSDILKKKNDIITNWNALLALDDYGSGYNGDVTMLEINPSIVKIDRLMITNIENDINRQSILHKLLFYAKERKIIVLAEGVETKSQMEYLIKSGVDLLQGFYISKPISEPIFNNDKIKDEIKEIINLN